MNSIAVLTVCFKICFPLIL
jgi:histidinol-phosphate aminotransferase